MAKGRSSKNYPPPRLVVPRKEAFRKMKRQIDTGQELRNQRIFSMMDLEHAREKREEWIENNTEILSRLLNNPSFAEEYKMGVSSETETGMTMEATGREFKQDINEQIRTLEAFVERMKLLPDPQTPEPAASPIEEKAVVEEMLEEEEIREVKSREEPPQPKPSKAEHPKAKEIYTKEIIPEEILPEETVPKETFRREILPKPKGTIPQEIIPEEILPKEIPPQKEMPRKEAPSSVLSDQKRSNGGEILLIHGRDEAVKESVVRFIEKMGLRASILHERAGMRSNITEKLTDRSHAFALILMTPDDIVAPRDNPKEGKARTSQNVAFEFGYCLGKLGQKRVCALHAEGMEIPWNCPGAVCIPMDARGLWRLLVAKEMKQAGVDVDLNKAI